MMLSILFLIPFISSILSFLIKNKRACFAFAILSCVATCIHSAWIYYVFDASVADLQLKEHYDFAFGFYNIGVDGVSLIFVILASFLTPFCLIASYSQIKERYSSFVSLFLMLEAFSI